jgi:S1-C subfamily serine protease
MNSLPPFSQPSFTPPPAPQPPERRSSRLVVPIVLASLLSAGLAAGATALVVDRGTDGAVTTVVRENVVDPVAEPLVGMNDSEAAIVEPAIEDGTAMDAAAIYRAYGSSVVRVEHSRGVGSGFVIDTDGHIVTNAHVVDGAQGGLTVSFSNDEKMGAELIGLDYATDIAVLKVDAPASALKPVVLGDSSQTYVGEEVVAIGNPFGKDRTVTAGIVSQLARQIPAPNGFAINGAIQTDAAINQGNSGGPLFDSGGRVIGINTQIISDGGGSDGIGFAVPVNLAKSVVDDIMEFGEAQHSWLGVRLSDVDETLASEADTGVDYGAMIAAVTPDSPAAKSGLRGATGEMTIAGTTYAVGGDIVIAANGEKIEDVISLQQVVGALNPGDTLTLEIKRSGGKTETIEVVLGNQPQEPIALGG